MRRICTVFIQLFFLTQIVLCQNRILYSSNSTLLKIDKYTNKFSVWDQSKNEMIEAPKIISTGKIFFNKDIITCIDSITKEKIVLQQIDEYRLIVIKKNRCFKTKNIFYAIKTSYKDGSPLQWMEWRNGKRDGCWRSYQDGGIKYILYENGVVKEMYFKTMDEIRNEGLKRPL